jgi:carbon storage regulator
MSQPHDDHLQEARLMLVLSRKVGQEIVIGGNVVVSVLSVNGNRVRLGIRAPAEVRVDRQEIHVARAERAGAPEPIENAAVTLCQATEPV